MSIIFGLARDSSAPIRGEELSRLADATKLYAMDGTFLYTSDWVGVGYQPYYTHARSASDVQPRVNGRNDVLVFDGRLDNRLSLCSQLGVDDEDSNDSVIVLAAFEKWGEESFSRLVGEWALVLAVHSTRSVYLVRDHAGTRTLYYERIGPTLVWSTYLDTFVERDSRPEISEEFIACYLSCQPIRNLTPYRNVKAVPPAHFVRLSDKALEPIRYWRVMARDQIHYNSDGDYEEHFLELFRQAVARRTGAGAAILAELSGGVDSSSIVCMSDYIRGSTDCSSSVLDTVSYYDDSEPNWDDRKYFSIVERHRGREGWHVRRSLTDRDFQSPKVYTSRYVRPGADRSVFLFESAFGELTKGKAYRVILSGNGGDELVGGVPAPEPEWADLIDDCNICGFLRNVVNWSVYTRTSVLRNVRSAVGYVRDLDSISFTVEDVLLPWLSPHLRELLATIGR